MKSGYDKRKRYLKRRRKLNVKISAEQLGCQVLDLEDDPIMRKQIINPRTGEVLEEEPWTYRSALLAAVHNSQEKDDKEAEKLWGAAMAIRECRNGQPHAELKVEEAASLQKVVKASYHLGLRMPLLKVLEGNGEVPKAE